MKKWLVVSSMIVVTAMAAVAWAGPRGPKGERGFRGGGPGCGPQAEWAILNLLDDPEVMKRVGVTDADVSQLREAMHAARRKSIEVKADRDVAQLDLRRLLKDPDATKPEVMQAVEQLGAYDTDLRKIGVSAQLHLRNNIGEEKYRALREQQRKPMRTRPDRRDRGRRGDRSRSRSGPDCRYEGAPYIGEDAPPPEEVE